MVKSSPRPPDERVVLMKLMHYYLYLLIPYYAALVCELYRPPPNKRQVDWLRQTPSVDMD